MDRDLDSGASEHLTNDEHSLVNVKLLKQPIKIRVAKAGISLLSKRVRELPGKTIVNGKEVDIRIKQVLYVPGLKFNLLSVPRLEALGLKIVFERGEGKIIKNDQLVAVAYRNHRIYELEIHDRLNVAGIANAVMDETKIWRERYD